MTDDEYQKACDIAANYRDVNMSHDQAVGYVYGFKQGVKWANANPSPRVMRLVEALKYIQNSNSEYWVDNQGKPMNKTTELIIAALADFESESGKAGE